VRGDIPILIGGSGERKTLRMVAQYADGCNVFGDPTRVRHLLDVLEEHCDRLGRDPAEITKTTMATIAIGETEEAARAKLDLMREVGVPAERVASFTVGAPDGIRELAEAYREVGIEGLTIRMPDAHDPEAVALVGETLAPVFTGSRTT
jgi:alkanesulfonate monooxygenase SsuD/methylene tetrahydromethanopterin reductase-like flavin-dependent oxidoreductase (luciferase family)